MESCGLVRNLEPGLVVSCRIPALKAECVSEHCAWRATWPTHNWRKRSRDHGILRFGKKLRTGVGRLLPHPSLESGVRIGALRLAGYLADPQLAEAIEASWNLALWYESQPADYFSPSAP